MSDKKAFIWASHKSGIIGSLSIFNCLIFKLGALKVKIYKWDVFTYVLKAIKFWNIKLNVFMGLLIYQKNLQSLAGIFGVHRDSKEESEREKR